MAAVHLMRGGTARRLESVKPCDIGVQTKELAVVVGQLLQWEEYLGGSRRTGLNRGALGS